MTGQTDTANTKKATDKDRPRYPPTERGVRVRATPNPNRNAHSSRAAKGEDSHGLDIACTRDALGTEIELIRRAPGHPSTDQRETTSTIRD